MSYILKAFVLILLSFTFSNAQSVVKENELAQTSMDKSAKRLLKNPIINSVSIGIYKDGKTYTSHYGELDKGKGNKPTDSTIYELASLSKTFTGTLVAKAVLDGKLTLEDDVRKYLDGDYPNLEYNGKPIKIKHLLSHTSRLPARDKFRNSMKGDFTDPNFMYEIVEAKKKYTKKDFFNYLREVEIDEGLGKEYLYSNVGTNLAAHIVEVVYKKPFEELLIEQVTSKLGMKDTRTNLNSEQLKRFANGYDGKENLMPHIPMPDKLWSAEGGIKSSMKDLLKYMEFQLDKDNAIANESHRVTYVDDEETSLGYFWVIDKNENGLHYSHHGGAYGTQNWFYAFPKYNMGISVISNTSTREMGGYLDEVVSDLLNDLKPFGKKSVMRAIRDKCEINVRKCIKLYKKLKKSGADKLNFENEDELNSMGYQLLNAKKTKDAIKIFKLNVKMFPNAFNPYDSLGEAYFVNKEYKKSLKNYKKSFELNVKNDNAEAMIKRIDELMKN